MSTEVSVREMMDREYVGVSESDDLVETVELLLRERAETAVVLRGSDPVGVLTERDILAILVEGPDPQSATVAEAMTESIPTIGPEASLAAAADKMSTREARRLVVTNGGEPQGVLTEHDVLASQIHEPVESIDETPVETSAGTAMAIDSETEATDTFEEQGICEKCGTLTRDLTAFNGQLLCGDCRRM